MKQFTYSLVACMFLFISCKKDSKLIKNPELAVVSETSQDNIFTGLKPQLKGLVIRDYDYILKNPDIYNDQMMAVTNAIIVKVNWEDIQTIYDGIISSVDIDAALQYINTKAVQANPIIIKLKIRVYCGAYSPEWVLDNSQYGGGIKKILFNDPDAGVVNLPRLWDAGYLNAFDKLIKRLAEKYDTDDRIAEITATPCGISTAEPCLLKSGKGIFTPATANWENCNNLWNAGYTIGKHLSANKSGINSLQTYFSHTRVSLSFGPYQILRKESNESQNYVIEEVLDTTKSFITYFNSKLGRKALMGNNGLRDPITSANGTDWLPPNGSVYLMYQFMKVESLEGADVLLFNRPHGITFQTAAAKDGQMGDLFVTLQSGVENWSGAVELPSLKTISPLPIPNSLMPFDAALENQALVGD